MYRKKNSQSRISSPATDAPCYQLYKQFQFRACAYLLFAFRFLGEETRNTIKQLILILRCACFAIVSYLTSRIIPNTFFLAQVTDGLLKYISYGDYYYFSELTYTNMTLTQRWNDVINTTSDVQRCFNLKKNPTYTDVVNQRWFNVVSTLNACLDISGLWTFRQRTSTAPGTRGTFS